MMRAASRRGFDELQRHTIGFADLFVYQPLGRILFQASQRGRQAPDIFGLRRTVLRIGVDLAFLDMGTQYLIPGVEVVSLSFGLFPRSLPTLRHGPSPPPRGQAAAGHPRQFQRLKSISIGTVVTTAALTAICRARRVHHTIFFSTLGISAAVKARSVWVLTLPSLATLSENAVIVSSSGASSTATTSTAPSVQ